MNDKYIQLDAAEVERQITRLIADFPELAEDEALRADMTEAETELHSILARIIDHRAEALEMVTGIEERAAHLTERKERYKRRAGAMTALAHRLMVVAGQSSIALSEASLSIRKGSESVEIYDLDALPQGTFKLIKQPDKVAIKTMLKAGDVPGASIKVGPDTLGVRTK